MIYENYLRILKYKQITFPTTRFLTGVLERDLEIDEPEDENEEDLRPDLILLVVLIAVPFLVVDFPAVDFETFNDFLDPFPKSR
jgi:hypothetical protein